MAVDLTKFPLLDSEHTKLPLDNPPYRSRMKNFYVDDDVTKNYIATAFRNIGDVIQAGELNEIHERQLLHDTLTNQMWSNWTSFLHPQDGTPISPPPSFGPGWAGTTPLYPGEFDANSTALASVGFSNSQPYSQVEAALLFKTVDTDDIGSGYLQANLKLVLNTGWYLINDTSFVTPKYWTSVPKRPLYDRVVQASGLKHWYYLTKPIMFDIVLVGESVSNLGGSSFPTLNITRPPESNIIIPFWQHSNRSPDFILGTTVSGTIPNGENWATSFNNFVTRRHDGAYFALDLADNSLCNHIDSVNCDENLGDSGSVQDSNPIQTSSIVNDTSFENPINTDSSDDGNSRRVKIKARPSYKHGIRHNIDPLNTDTDITDETSDTTSSRSRSTNIILGNVGLTNIEESGNIHFHDKIPTYSLCVKCEHNTQSVADALSTLNDYYIEHAPGTSMLESFDSDEAKELRDVVFQLMKEGLKPRFINNVMVNATIYDVDVQGQTDAENEWNSHFDQLEDALVVEVTTDLRQIEPI